MTFSQPPNEHPDRSRILLLAASVLVLVLLAGTLFAGHGIEPAQAAALRQDAPEDSTGTLDAADLTATPEAGDLPAAEATLAPARSHFDPERSDCLDCHQLAEMTGVLGDSTVVHLGVDEEALKTSVHYRLGKCSVCHAGYAGYPHKNSNNVSCAQCHFNEGGSPVISAPLGYANQREMTAALNNRCFTCHKQVFMTFSTGMHARHLNNGNLSAPLCSDCHGSHTVQKADRLIYSEACGKCHDANYNTLMSSVHGAELLKKSPQDAPTCADCHDSHTVSGPRDPDFRKNTVASCLKCHQDKAMMSRSGLEAEIFEPNIDNFHSLSPEVFERKDVNISGRTPVCFDCHGVHTIRSASDLYSSVSPGNVLTTCLKCHQNDQGFTVPGRAHLPASSAGVRAAGGIKQASGFLIPGSFGLMMVYLLLDARRRLVEKNTEEGASHDENKS